MSKEAERLADGWYDAIRLEPCFGREALAEAIDAAFAKVREECAERAVKWLETRDYGNWGETDALHAAILDTEAKKEKQEMRLQRNTDGLWIHLHIGSQYVSVNLSTLEIARKLVAEYDLLHNLSTEETDEH